eukprot:TRINITY_DN4341_c0_g1_i2.p1 TRINITY_DN4341_c0_g1~~TRINITY_DN4341_c0_g1_i2.p1  ORF type:complete len:228 (+),score=89.97 TRINITY_DN4341_c0_g1_i2:630-1313(+)
MGRVWGGGRGGQCGTARLEGIEYCRMHKLEAEDPAAGGLPKHGRVGGAIPEKKLKDFMNCAKKEGWPAPTPEGFAWEEPTPSERREVREKIEPKSKAKKPDSEPDAKRMKKADGQKGKAPAAESKDKNPAENAEGDEGVKPATKPKPKPKATTKAKAKAAPKAKGKAKAETKAKPKATTKAKAKAAPKAKGKANAKTKAKPKATTKGKAKAAPKAKVMKVMKKKKAW